MPSTRQRVRSFRHSSEKSTTAGCNKVTKKGSTTSGSNDSISRSGHAFASITKRVTHHNINNNNNVRRLRHRNSTSHNARMHQRRKPKERKTITQLPQLTRTECRSNIMTALSRLHEAVNESNAKKEQKESDTESIDSFCSISDNHNSNEQEEECAANTTPAAATTTAALVVTPSQINSNVNSSNIASDAANEDDFYQSVPIPVHVFEKPSVEMCYALHILYTTLESGEEHLEESENNNIAYMLSNGTCGIFFATDHSCFQLLHLSIGKKWYTYFESNNVSAKESCKEVLLIESCQQQQQQQQQEEQYQHQEQKEKEWLVLLMYIDSIGKAFIVSPCTLQKIEMKQEQEDNINNKAEKRIGNCVENERPCNLHTNSKEMDEKIQSKEEQLEREVCLTETEIIENSSDNRTSYFVIPSMLEEKFAALAQAFPILNKQVKQMEEYNIKTNDNDNTKLSKKVTNNVLPFHNVQVELEPTRWQLSILLCEEIIHKETSAAYGKSKSTSSSSVADEQIHYRVDNLGFGEVVRVVDCNGSTSSCAIEDKLRDSYQFSSPASLWRIPYVARVTLNELESCNVTDIDSSNNNNKSNMCKYTFTLANKLIEFT